MPEDSITIPFLKCHEREGQFLKFDPITVKKEPPRAKPKRGLACKHCSSIKFISWNQETNEIYDLESYMNNNIVKLGKLVKLDNGNYEIEFI